jgi:Rrf2 family protein
MLSYTCKSAIKAVVFLASHFSDHRKASVQEISENIDASAHTVGKFLQILVRHGVIKSTKGPSGGFFLSEKQFNQSIINIVYAIDGKQMFIGCGLGLPNCSEQHPCPLHDQYKTARDALEAIFEGSSVADLWSSVSSGISHLAG